VYRAFERRRSSAGGFSSAMIAARRNSAKTGLRPACGLANLSRHDGPRRLQRRTKRRREPSSPCLIRGDVNSTARDRVRFRVVNIEVVFVAQIDSGCAV